MVQTSNPMCMENTVGSLNLCVCLYMCFACACVYNCIWLLVFVFFPVTQDLQGIRDWTYFRLKVVSYWPLLFFTIYGYIIANPIINV